MQKALHAKKKREKKINELHRSLETNALANVGKFFKIMKCDSDMRGGGSQFLSD